jgi:hypothetical protein
MVVVGLPGPHPQPFSCGRGAPEQVWLSGVLAPLPFRGGVEGEGRPTITISTDLLSHPAELRRTLRQKRLQALGEVGRRRAVYEMLLLLRQAI